MGELDTIFKKLRTRFQTFAEKRLSFELSKLCHFERSREILIKKTSDEHTCFRDFAHLDSDFIS